MTVFVGSASFNLASPERLPALAQRIAHIRNFFALDVTHASASTISGFLAVFLLGILAVTFLHFAISVQTTRTSIANASLLRFWIVSQRLLLPLPASSLGSLFGLLTIRLTSTLDQSRSLLVDIACITLWVWVVSSTLSAYSGSGYTRGSDVCQIRQRFVTFEVFVTSLPLLLSVIPYVFDLIFGDKYLSSTFFFAVAALTNLLLGLVTLFKLPYVDPRMNSFMSFVFFEAIPVSGLWFFFEHSPNSLGLYLLLAFGFAVFAWPLTHLCSSSEAQQNTELPAEEEAPQPPLPWPHNVWSLTIQDVFVTGYFVAGALVMVFANALAARNMPLSDPLPDVAHRAFNVAEELRNSASFGPLQLSNIAIIIEAVWMITSIFATPNALNIRRAFFIYSTVAFMRSVAFCITALPPPCAGMPKCPCADPEAVHALRSANPAKIAFSWLFGLGIVLKYPQCGDLIVSGHTQFLWNGLRVIQNCNRGVYREPFLSLINTALFGFILTSMAFIIIVRNHYSIDVFFGWILTELLWMWYRAAQAAITRPASPSDPWYVKFVRWVEKRPVGSIQ
jgi:hypothetical protein